MTVRRFVILGAGAVGCTIAWRLLEAGHQVVLLARGPHGRAMKADGLRVLSHEGEVRLRPFAVSNVRELEICGGDVVICATKSQDTEAALAALADVATSDTPIVCAQNGVNNERVAMRRFEHVYGGHVAMPSDLLKPGVVHAFGDPVPGVVDVGRYPWGRDDLAESLVEVFAGCGLDSEAPENVMPRKYDKLLYNVSNALEALCGKVVRSSYLWDLPRHEAEQIFEVAGICRAHDERQRVRAKPIGSLMRRGNSVWQSLHRATGHIETDYLNGEVVLLARLRQLRAPINALLSEEVRALIREGRPPGSVPVGALSERIEELVSKVSR